MFFLFLGMSALVLGAELLVRYAAKLALGFGVRPLIIGLILVAYGTGAPEIAIMIDGMLEEHSTIGIGNVIGTNILNILLILGFCALIAPIDIAQKLVKIDVSIMIVISAVFYIMAIDGMISLVDGWILLAGLIGYTVFTFMESRNERPEIENEYAQEFGQGTTRVSLGGRFLYILFIFMGIALIVIGAHLTVIHASVLARSLGVSELIIGLTIIAIGTSLPEIVTAIMAMIRKEPDIATGMIVGSNIANILGVLGISIVVLQTPIPVPEAALNFDLPFMLIVSIVCFPIFLSGYKIERWEGAVLLILFALYMTYVFLNSSHHDSLPKINAILLIFSLPLIFATIVTLFKQNFQKDRKA